MFQLVRSLSLAALMLSGLGYWTTPLRAQPASAEPTDLALVHPDALAVVQVQIADIWKHESMRDIRQLMLKAGPKALAELDSQFAPKPSTIERVTVVMLPTENNFQDLPPLLVIMRFSEAFDQKRVLQCLAPSAVSKKLPSREIFVEESSESSLYFADDRTLVYSDIKTMSTYFTWAPKRTGGVKSALLAEGNKPLIGVVNLLRIPELDQMKEAVPGVAQPLLKAQTLSVSSELAKQVKLSAKLGFGTAEDATEAEGALRKLAEVGRFALEDVRKEAERLVFNRPDPTGVRPIGDLPQVLSGVAGLAGLNFVDEILAAPPVKTTGTRVELTVELPNWSNQILAPAMLSAGLALPAVQKAREAAARAQQLNNLKQIGLAMHSYHDVNNQFPAAAITDKQGKRLLSWRVTVLPYLEGDQLYRQFKLDEPWDSEHNKKLIRFMPKVYADSRKPAPEGYTYFKAFVGKDAAFNWDKGMKYQDFTDGLSNTLLVGAAGDPVIWTKPDDFEFDPAKPLPDLSKPFGNLLALLGDGSVRMINFPPGKDQTKMLKLLIQRNDGMPVNIDE